MMAQDREDGDKGRASDLIREAWDVRMLDEFDGAIFKALEAVALDPDDWYINISLGEFYRENGDLERAEQFCRRALELAPNNAGSWENLAMTYYFKGMFSEAVEHFSKAVNLEERPRTYSMMASAKIELGDLNGAAKDSKRALELDPEWDEADEMLQKAQDLLAST